RIARWGGATRKPSPSSVWVVSHAPETLGPKGVRQPLLADVAELIGGLLDLAFGDLAHLDREAVAPEMARLQLVRMGLRVEDPDPLEGQIVHPRGEASVVFWRDRERQHLRRDGLLVLEPRDADLAHRHAHRRGDRAERCVAREASLLETHE